MTPPFTSTTLNRSGKEEKEGGKGREGGREEEKEGRRERKTSLTRARNSATN